MLLITGASGFVGQHLVSALEDYSPSVPAHGFSYLPLGCSSVPPGGISVDLRDPAKVAELFRNNEFDGIIHLAAESRTGECQKNPELAYASNTNATRNLLQAAAPQQSWFLYVSTDMVFSGHEGNYAEQDTPAPILHYGKSKALAEESVRHYPAPWCIVRPALIYGAPAGGRGSMLSWTLETLRGGHGAFFTDEIRTPVWVDDLVKLLLGLYRTRHEGIVHAGGPERISRFDFAAATARIWDIPQEKVAAARLSDMADACWRPRDVSLNSAAAQRIQPFTSMNEALSAIRASGAL